MDLQHAINDLKYVERFMKSLSKVIGTMEIVQDLERREKEIKGSIEILESKKQIASDEAEAAEGNLTVRQQNSRQEMKKISDRIKVEKEELLRGYENQLTDKQENVNLLEKHRIALIQEVKDLEKSRSELKTEVINLKKAISNAGSAVSSVE